MLPPLGNEGAHLRSSRSRRHDVADVGHVPPVRQLELQRHGDVLPVENVHLATTIYSWVKGSDASHLAYASTWEEPHPLPKTAPH